MHLIHHPSFRHGQDLGHIRNRKGPFSVLQWLQKRCFRINGLLGILLGDCGVIQERGNGGNSSTEEGGQVGQALGMQEAGSFMKQGSVCRLH